MIEQHPPLTGPLRNWVYTSTNRAFLHPTNGLLMVSRLDGPDANIARGLVDKALQAEADGLWGRAYFDLRSITNTDYKLGDEWIRGASELCRHWGFETIVDEQPETFPAEFPMSQIAFYCGWYDPAASGPFARPTVEFMPGAFAYHLHSYSAARLRSPTENWVGPLLARGATISMGSNLVVAVVVAHNRRDRPIIQQPFHALPCRLCQRCFPRHCCSPPCDN
jgi:uncharacterized protein (TIGR03790 family)